MIDIENLRVKQNTFEKLPERLRYNSVMKSYYERFCEEEKNEILNKRTLLNKGERLTNCAQLWTSNYYRWLNTKEILSANLCRDRFCLNCQSALAYQRYLKFSPLLSNFSVTNSIYHCVFTVKNCKGLFLKSTIKTMFKSYYTLNEYLNGRKKIKSYDFEEFGYIGSVRALEVTFNKESNEYHPHLHCLLLLDKNLRLRKHVKNAFSYDKHSDEIVLFSEEEILFQKIWYLLNNGQKVNQKNIESLELGYSVEFKRADERSFKEVFKYAFKADLDKDECMGFDVFKTYFKTLPGLRFISGYGVLHGIKFEDDAELEDLTKSEIVDYFKSFEELEPPVVIHEHYTDVERNIKNDQVYLTRNALHDAILSDIDDSRLTEESKQVLEEFIKKNNHSEKSLYEEMIKNKK